MPVQVEITAHCIAQSRVNPREMREWLNSDGAVEYPWDHPDYETRVSDAALIVGNPAKRCFDDQTEILTSEGWKRFADLSGSEQVMTLNLLTNQMEWQQPHGYLRESYNGPMVEAEGRDISMLITPDHRVLCSSKGQYRIELAQTCLSLCKVTIPTAGGNWTGTRSAVELPEYAYQQKQGGAGVVQTRVKSARRTLSGPEVTAFAKLLAYYVTEGSLSHPDGRNAKVVIYGSHTHEIEALCRVLGWTCSSTKDKRNGCPRTQLGGGQQLHDYLLENCGHGSVNKHLPRWVLELPTNDLEQVWQILVRTDGTITRNGQECLITTSPELAGQAQELLSKMGSWGSIHEQPTSAAPIEGRHTVYRVARRKGKAIRLNTGAGRPALATREYSGTIHCVSTRNGVVLVRRNHGMFWSGNCYKSFEVGLNPNVTRVRADWAEYLENIMRSGHGSVLEHASWTWAIEGVTRVFTAEMNRHRAGVAISEGSLRFIRFTPDGIPFWMPLSIRPHPEDTPELAHKKARSRAIFLKAFQSDGEFYEELCSIWAEELKPESKFKAKKEITSMMRRIIGMGVSTGGVWTLNLRALRHLFTMRVAAAAEEEICHAIGLVAKQTIESEPMLLGDFKQTPEGFWIPKYVKV